MTRREIAALACKVLALWLMAQAAIPLLDVMAQCVWLIFTWNLDRLSGPSALAVIAATGVTFLVSGGVGLFLWLKASSLASRMASDDATPVARPGITYEDMMSLAFVVVGVVTLVTAARDMVACVARAAPRGGDYSPLWYGLREDPGFWSALVGICLSLWLILGSRGLVRVIHLARESAQSDFEPPPEQPPPPVDKPSA